MELDEREIDHSEENWNIITTGKAQADNLKKLET